MSKVRIGTAQLDPVLNRERGDPEIVRRNGGTLLAELQKNSGVVFGGQVVREENTDARTRQKLSQRSQILRLPISRGKSGAQFAQYHQRKQNAVGATDDVDPNRIASQEVAVGIRVERDAHLFPDRFVDLLEGPDGGVKSGVVTPGANQGIEIMMRADNNGLPAAAILGQPRSQPRNLRLGEALDRMLNFGDGAHGEKCVGIASRFKAAVSSSQDAALTLATVRRVGRAEGVMGGFLTARIRSWVPWLRPVAS